MPPTRRFKFEVYTQRSDGRRDLVSRHHKRGTADRRIIRFPLSPGQTIEIFEKGQLIRMSRCPLPDDPRDIPF